MNTSRNRLVILSFIFILLSELTLLFLPGYHSDRLTEQLSDKILRLHIIADDDSDTAQAVKLLVRDAVCEYLSPLPEGIDSKAEVCKYLTLHLTELTELADEVLQQHDCNYHAYASIERRFFPLKTYGSYTFPPGEYDALCITLGSGSGQNWWCLAFPSLCLLDGSYAVTDSDSEQQLKILLTDEEYEAILLQEPKILFRFRLLEWLKGKYK